MNAFFSEDCKNNNRGHILFSTDGARYKYVKKNKSLIGTFYDESYSVTDGAGVYYVLNALLDDYPQHHKVIKRILRHLSRRVIPSTRKFGV